MRKITLKFIQSFVKTYNGRCLNKTYINAHQKMTWKCKLGHIWDAFCYAIINKKQWCPECAKIVLRDKSTKHTIEEAKQIAKKHNGWCLSKKYLNNRTHLKWKCKFGHIWYAIFASILRGNWCKKCAMHRLKKTIKDARKLAKINGGDCLSNEYVNNHTNLKWRCCSDHIWNATYNNVQRGRWCPHCRRKNSKNQEYIIQILHKLFPHYTIINNFKGFDWLKVGNRGKLEIDIWVPELKLAIEYDGEHHFKPTRFFGTDVKMAIQKFKRQRQLDKLKNKLVKRHKNDISFFLRFKYTDNLTEDFIKNKLNKVINFVQSYKLKEMINDRRDYASKKPINKISKKNLC